MTRPSYLECTVCLSAIGRDTPCSVVRGIPVCTLCELVAPALRAARHELGLAVAASHARPQAAL